MKTQLNKMKISELKARIKEAILAETMYFKGPGAKTNDDNALSETKKKKDKETSEADMDIPEVDVETSTDLDIPSTALTSPQDVQKELMDALEAAKNLGDKKLVRQIGNALTYFTRSQVADQENMNEEFKLNMQRIAGIIN